MTCAICHWPIVAGLCTKGATAVYHGVSYQSAYRISLRDSRGHVTLNYATEAAVKTAPTT